MSDRLKAFKHTAGIVCVASVLTAVPVAGQTPESPDVPPGPLTLEQVLSLSEPRSESVGVAQRGVQRAEGDQVRAKAGLHPQLTASASYDRAITSEFAGIFDNITGDFGGLQDLPFGRVNTYRATLSFSQNLYSGGRNGAQTTLAAVGHDSATLELTTARAQLMFDVTRAYYDAVLSDRLVAIAGATLDQAGATLRQVEAGFGAGTQPEFEVLRARVARDNQRPALIRRRVDRDLAYLRLKQMLELPAGYDLRLADALNDESLPPPRPFVERVAAVEQALDVDDATVTIPPDLELPARTAVAQAGAAVRLNEASLKLTRAQAMPTVALLSTYSRIAYPSNAIRPTFDRSNWSIGATVSVPVLTGGLQKGNELVARAELEQSRLQQKQVEELAVLDTRSAWAELLAARAAWEASAGTVQQADRAYEIATVRYGAGVSTQLELSDARVQRQQAEANRAQAARDLQVARAHVALLPDLPLATPSGVGTLPVVPQTSPAPQAPTQPSGSGQFRNAFAQ